MTNLVAAVSSQQFLKCSAPTWHEGTPFYTGFKREGVDNSLGVEAVESAHQVFIRAAAALLREWPRSHGLRAVATNFQV